MAGKWIREWNKNLTQKTNIYYSNFNLDYNFNGVFNSSQQVQTLIKNNQIKEFGFKTTFSLSKSLTSSYNFGYEYTNNDVN